MKFAIDIGHNAPTKDTGARGIKYEDILTKEVGKRVIKILRAAGHVVVETCPKNSPSLNYSLQHRVEVANNSQADIFVSIHFNAFNRRAYGSEVFAISKAGAAIARSILDEIVKLGFHDRGVKRAPFYVIKHTNMPAVLVECCFCDSNRDMEIYDPIRMAEAIAAGLIGELPGNENELRTLRVKQDTWLKKSTDQAKNLRITQKRWIDEGKYQVLSAIGSEEQHHFIKLQDGSEWFIYTEHAAIE